MLGTAGRGRGIAKHPLWNLPVNLALSSRRLSAATQERNPTLTYPRLLHFVGFRFINFIA